MAADARVDTVVGAVRTTQRAAPGHRGSAPLTLDDAGVRQVIDGMVGAGALVRRGTASACPAIGPAWTR